MSAPTPEWSKDEITDMRDQRWEAFCHLVVGTLAAGVMGLRTGDTLTLALAGFLGVMAALMGLCVRQDRRAEAEGR